MARRTPRKSKAASAAELAGAAKPSLSNTAYTRIREAIQNGDLMPGDRILEDEIARGLHISRTPVRDALRRLEDEGFLVHQAHRGMTVAKLDYQMVMELFVVRDVLEGAAARMAAHLGSAAEIEMLVEMTRREKEAAASAESMALHNRRFHTAIYMMAHNRYLLKTLNVLTDSMALLSKTSFSQPERRMAAMEEHWAIVEAIQARNPDRAETLARAHIHSAHRTRLRMLSESQDLGFSAGTGAIAQDERMISSVGNLNRRGGKVGF
jgi:DNA-binding GntR family transcriptional regulator